MVNSVALTRLVHESQAGQMRLRSSMVKERVHRVAYYTSPVAKRQRIGLRNRAIIGSKKTKIDIPDMAIRSGHLRRSVERYDASPLRSMMTHPAGPRIGTTPAALSHILAASFPSALPRPIASASPVQNTECVARTAKDLPFGRALVSFSCMTIPRRSHRLRSLRPRAPMWAARRRRRRWRWRQRAVARIELRDGPVVGVLREQSGR